VTAHWGHRVHAETVRRIAERAIRRWEQYHVYAFCLSEHRDTAQHWNIYVGLNIQPTADDPHVAIGFDAQELFYPQVVTAKETPISRAISEAASGHGASRCAYSAASRGVPGPRYEGQRQAAL
jgi:hypothetical protein